MIRPIKIEPITYEHFDPNDNSLGFLNDYENTWLRIEIVKNQIEGYYLISNGEKFNIELNGKINNHFRLYTQQEELLTQLFKTQRNYETQN